MRTARYLGIGLALGLVLGGCGGTPASEPGAAPGAADDGSANGGSGADEVCRPPLTDDDPDPLAGGGQHDVFAGENWVEPVMQAALRDHADTFAGLWLDQHAGEVVVMLTGDDPGPVLEALRTHADHPEALVCMHAEHTEADLDHLANEAFTALQAGGSVVSGGTDLVRNRVVLEYEGDPEEARELLGELADHPALLVRQPACAEVEPVPDDAVALPGDGSTCVAMDALASGTLTGDAGAGCLWLEHDGTRTDVVWPRAWYVTSDGVVHDHHGQARAAIGDEVGAGGGNAGPDGGDALPDDCREPGANVWVLGSLDPAG
ncbi:hypothetical protein [Egicoccus sp. AB-alg2]|uniref:hypothetical protein n=1 Tax=Egicoccus sp. AB-alg2 TaxID=3242693 RepID=UPI00359D804F